MNSWIRNLPIKDKLIVIAVPACVLGLVLAIAVLVIHDVIDERRTTVEHLSALVHMIGINSTAALAFDDRQHGHELLAAMQAEPEVVAAHLYDADGKLFARYRSADARYEDFTDHLDDRDTAKNRASTTENEWLDFGNGCLHLGQRIFSDGRLLGSAQVEFDLAALRAKIVTHLLLGLMVLLVATAITYLLVSRLQRMISVPILDLATGMQTVSETHNYSLRVDKRTDDELGTLMDGFNSMLARIETHDGELHVAKLAAEDASRAKSNFLATMSHEIRTPLNGVLGMAELIQGTSLDSRQQRYADNIRRSGESLLTIINDILDFSKIEAGRMELDDSVFDLRRIAEDVCELLAEPAQRKGLELICGVDPLLPNQFRGDGGRVRQILTNLVGNAIKFTHHGEIDVRIAVAEETETAMLIRFSVRDTGIGVNPDEHENIFDAFTQVDGSHTREYGGTGLGLAVSKQLAEMMGGSIGVEAMPEGGSRFWFTARLERTSGTRPSRTASSHALRGLRVLVVDDNATNRTVLLEQLSIWEMSGTSVADGRQAVDLLRDAALEDDPFELVLLDHAMPGIDGVEVARLLRSDPLTRNLPLVMLTSLDSSEAEDKKQTLDLQAHLTKPVRQSDLWDCMVGVIDPQQIPPRSTDEADCTRRAMKRGSKVLLAEDNAINQELAVEVLRTLGFEVDVAENGQRAFEMADASYAAVLMDCHMPVMDGFAATREIRAKVGDRYRLPIIALTANALLGDRERCLKHGMDDYLSKPFTKLQLEEVLGRWIEPVGPSTASNGTAADATTDGERVLDHRVLENIAALQRPGKPSVLQRVIGMYLDTTPTNLASLLDAVTQSDAERTRQAAHSLKSSSANVGATALADACQQLETQSRDGNLESADALLMQIDELFAATREALRVAVELETA